VGTPLHELMWQTRGNHQLIEHLQPGCLVLLELTLASPYPLIVAPTDVVAVAITAPVPPLYPTVWRRLLRFREGVGGENPIRAGHGTNRYS
jgi:hypothetical protein